MHNPPPSSAETKPFVMLVIYAAFVAAAVVYLGIHLSGLLDDPDVEDFPPAPGLRIALYVVAVGSMIAGFVLPPYLETESSNLKLGIRVHRMVVRLACFEAIGIYGLVGTFLGLSRVESLGFLLFSLLLLLASGIWVLALYQSMSRPAAEQNYRR